MLMHAPFNCLGIAIEGRQYDVDEKGIADIEVPHVSIAASHGFKLSDYQVPTALELVKKQHQEAEELKAQEQEQEQTQEQIAAQLKAELEAEEARQQAASKKSGNGKNRR